jgi:adenylosuccinate synthase
LNVDKTAELERYRVFAERIRPLVVESVSFLHGQIQDGKSILVEGANAAMLDLDFGKAINNIAKILSFIYTTNY